MTAEALSMEWDLSDLFHGIDDPRINATIDQVQRDTITFQTTYRNTINIAGGPDVVHLHRAFVEQEHILDLLTRVRSYAELLFYLDTNKAEYRNFQQQSTEFEMQITNELVFFNLELLALDEEAAQRLINNPELEPYCDHVRRSRRLRPHMLGESEEKIANEKSITGTQAWQNLFAEVSAAFEFQFVEADGSEHTGSLDEALARMQQPSRSIRRQAFEALYGGLAKKSELMASIYNNIVQDQLIDDRLRGYTHPMQRRNLSDMLPTEVVLTMLDVVEHNTDIAQDYFRLKARLLELPALQIYDQYAPTSQDTATSVSYSQARSIILDALGNFDPETRQIAQNFFDRGWIDASVRPGKRGSACCFSTVPALHPYVFYNYMNVLRDVNGMAHELGHAIHMVKSAKQTLLNFSATTPMSEIASIFFEMVVFEELVAQQSDSNTIFALTCAKLDDSFTTVFRQVMFTRFEQAMFTSRQEQRQSVEAIGQHWLDANRSYYGSAVELTPGYEYGWTYIPHIFHSPFYCYSYAFAELIVHALYSMYREEGKSFVPHYLRLLESGGSLDPITQLRDIVGIDVRNPDFWQRGINELRRLVQQAHNLAPKGKA